MFLQLPSGIKVKLVDKVMQSNYLCVTLHVKRKKTNSHCFTWFLILDKIQDGGQDGDHLWWRHRPPAAPPPIKYTLSCREDLLLKIKGFQLKAKIVSKYCNIQKTQGGFHQPPPPLPSLYHGGVTTLRVRPRVKPGRKLGRINFRKDFWGCY